MWVSSTPALPSCISLYNRFIIVDLYYSTVGISEQTIEDEVMEIDITDSPTNLMPNEVDSVDPPNLYTVVKECIAYCQTKNIEGPIEILRVAQRLIVNGRKL